MNCLELTIEVPDPPDPLALESVAHRPGEVHIGGLDALDAGSGGTRQNTGVGAGERLVDDVDVAVRFLHTSTCSRVCEGRREGRARSRG